MMTPHGRHLLVIYKVILLDPSTIFVLEIQSVRNKTQEVMNNGLPGVV